MTTDFWTSWQNFTNISTSGWLPNDLITYLFEDSVWNIWIGTQWWLAKYNNSSTWINYISPDLLGNYIHSIYQDVNWNILVLSDWWLDTINSSWNIVTGL